MRPLREDERDEIQSLQHLIQYVLTKKNIERYKVWETVLEFQDVCEKYILPGIVSEEELSELLDIDDMKELITKLFHMFQVELSKDE